MKNTFFNAQHAPIGAFASFTLGFPGPNGGFGLEIGRPAGQQIYIGVQSRDGAHYQALPFFGPNSDDIRANYESMQNNTAVDPDHLLRPFPREQIQRHYQLTTDTWHAPDLTFRLISPVHPVPDPTTASDDDLRSALVPAIFAELTIDNRQGMQSRRAFFGWQKNDLGHAMRRLQDAEPGLIGIGQGRETAVIACDPDVKTGNGFVIDAILTASKPSLWRHGLGPCSALLFDVPPGQQRTVRFAVCWHKAGIVTANLDASYTYTRVFPTIESVARYARDHADVLIAEWEAANEMVNKQHLSDDQRFMLIHAIRSYYGSTQLLDVDKRPFWIVNEGEYRMINTFDLAADQLFYECRLNPWTVRNVLDWYAERYSYHDQIHAPGDKTLHPGGIGFTHDMGVANVLSRPGYSAYELSGLDGLFSYMTHEELVNWVCCAGVYLAQTEDPVWREKRLDTFKACLYSLMQRDHPDPTQRDGVMDFDSNRTQFGGEITTYDSLDISLGQARRNLYLAGKTWAAYVLLEKIFTDTNHLDLAQQAHTQAQKCAQTITANLTEEGFIPAILSNLPSSIANRQSAPRIIPAIEGLIFPYMGGCQDALDENGRFAPYLSALKTHLQTILVPGTCLFADGGWKLSSTSDNSWLSKIYLSQFIARQILGLKWDENGRQADAAHMQWLTHPQLSYWAWSDQIVAGNITGSKYYPRGVTAVLWLDES